MSITGTVNETDNIIERKIYYLEHCEFHAKSAKQIFIIPYIIFWLNRGD